MTSQINASTFSSLKFSNNHSKTRESVHHLSYSSILCSQADSLHCCCMWFWINDYPFTVPFLNIHQSGVLTVLSGCYMADATWNCCHLSTHSENSPAIPTRTWTCDLSYTSLTLYHWAAPTPWEYREKTPHSQPPKSASHIHGESWLLPTGTEASAVGVHAKVSSEIKTKTNPKPKESDWSVNHAVAFQYDQGLNLCAKHLM